MPQEDISEELDADHVTRRLSPVSRIYSHANLHQLIEENMTGAVCNMCADLQFIVFSTGENGTLHVFFCLKHTMLICL